MREIKFRAWLKEDHMGRSRMQYFGLARIENDELDTYFCGIKDFYYDGNLMQYTGLKDKNGKEPYWDDIVSDGINPPFVITPDYHLLARLSEIEFEVIGNIYENPELLKETK